MRLQPAPAPSDDAADPAADARYYRQVLHALIDMGADLARMVHAEATAPANVPPEPVPGVNHPAAAERAPAADPTIAFDRLARAIRRTISLARRLDEPLSTRHTIQRAAEQHHAAARRHIIRAVEDAIQRHPPYDAESDLHAEFEERLDAPGLDDDIDHRAVSDIIVDICRDLGIAWAPGMPADASPWKRRTPAIIAALHARAAARPGSGTLGDQPKAEAEPRQHPFQAVASLSGLTATQPAPRLQADDG